MERNEALAVADIPQVFHAVYFFCLHYKKDY